MRNGRSLHVGLVSLMAIWVFAPGPAGALDVVMGGDFQMNSVNGEPGADLLQILGHDNSWSITLSDVQFVESWGYDCSIEDSRGTFLYASDFFFQFTGPDAPLLNDLVATRFTQGALNGAVFAVWDTACLPEHYEPRYMFYIWPEEPDDGISLEIGGLSSSATFPVDENGYPIIGSFTLEASQTILADRRGSNDGLLAANNASTLRLETTTAVESSSWGSVKRLFR
jgi:hypothetical protein